MGQGSIRTAQILVTDARGFVVEDKSENLVYSQHLTKDQAGPYGQGVTAAQMLGLTKADSATLYLVDPNLQKPVGMAVIFDTDNDPIGSYALWEQKTFACASLDEIASCQ